MSFDPWGMRQYADWANGDPTGGDTGYYPTTRGYTGHEMLDQEQLIHMNGRVYDPVIGRFLSPDLLISAPYNSQSFNRYSYVLNNPLSLVDPSGYDANGPCPECSDNIFSHGRQNQAPCQATTCYNDSDAEAFRDQMVMQSYDGWGASGIYGGQYFAQQADPFQNVDFNIDLTQGNGEQNSSQGDQQEVFNWLKFGVGSVNSVRGVVGVAGGTAFLSRSPAVGSMKIVLGISNLNRGIQQIKESMHSREEPNLKNLWGLFPFGQKFDDLSEPAGPINYFYDQKEKYVDRPLETMKDMVQDFFVINSK